VLVRREHHVGLTIAGQVSWRVDPLTEAIELRLTGVGEGRDVVRLAEPDAPSGDHPDHARLLIPPVAPEDELTGAVAVEVLGDLDVEPGVVGWRAVNVQRRDRGDLPASAASMVRYASLRWSLIAKFATARSGRPSPFTSAPSSKSRPMNSSVMPSCRGTVGLWDCVVRDVAGPATPPGVAVAVVVDPVAADFFGIGIHGGVPVVAVVRGGPAVFVLVNTG
jgi:hypothetical protein